MIFKRAVVIRIKFLRAWAGLVWRGLAWAGLGWPEPAWAGLGGSEWSPGGTWTLEVKIFKRVVVIRTNFLKAWADLIWPESIFRRRGLASSGLGWPGLAWAGLSWPRLAWEAPNGALEDLEARGEDFQKSCSHQN